MKYTKTKTVVFIAFLGILSCSGNPFDFESDEIGVKVSDTHLTVYNLLHKPIYYFAVEEETSWVLDWAPISSDENKINPGQKKKIALDDVFGYQQGKKIIIYYWTGTDLNSINVKTLQIDT